MRAAYFDCFAGASGDMILGALLDAGLDPELLRAELIMLPLRGYGFSVERTQRAGIWGTAVTVDADPDQPESRPLDEIVAMIEDAYLDDGIKEKSLAIFRRLAAAEARVHGVDVGAVHFHELGAVDAIVDIVGSMIGFNALGIEAFYSSPLPTGAGAVSTAHGVLPVPAPATLELIADAKAAVRPTPSGEIASGEAVTPTAAAIITTIASFAPPPMTIERVGCGVGRRELPTVPNIMRLWIGETLEEATRDLLQIETNIDDMNPELFGYVLERLFAVGAKDVWFTPIQMKKNRPATKLSVLATPDLEPIVVQTLLRETSTLGVRVMPVRRHEASRETSQFATSLGTVAVKVKRLPDGATTVAPEYEDCRRIALERGMPLQEVYRIVSQEVRGRFV